MKPESYFANVYESREFIDARFSDHVYDHAAKMKANNVGGLYTARITATETAHTDFLAKKSGMLGGLAIQKSWTITVDEQEMIYRSLVRRVAGTILSKYDKKSSVWADIIPLKLSKFTYPKRSQISPNIDHFITKLNDHALDFGTDLHDDFVTLKATFDPARQTQEIKIGAMKTLRVEKTGERNDLNLQMYDNLLFFAGQFKLNPAMGLAFFDFSKLYYHTIDVENQLNDIMNELSVQFAGIESKNSGLINIAGKTALFTRIEGGRYQIYTVASLDDLTPGENTIFMEENVDELEVALNDIGAATNPYLIIRHLNDDAGEMAIEWL